MVIVVNCLGRLEPQSSSKTVWWVWFLFLLSMMDFMKLWNLTNWRGKQKWKFPHHENLEMTLKVKVFINTSTEWKWNLDSLTDFNQGGSFYSFADCGWKWIKSGFPRDESEWWSHKDKWIKIYFPNQIKIYLDRLEMLLENLCRLPTAPSVDPPMTIFNESPQNISCQIKPVNKNFFCHFSSPQILQ